MIKKLYLVYLFSIFHKFCPLFPNKVRSDICSCFFNKNEHAQVPLLDRSAPFMNDFAVSKDGVIKLLKGLNPSKALGPDELHPRVLKELATELGPVFAHVFSTIN